MSVLLIMWAAKQTKKGVVKADVAIKRRSQMRMEKRMTKLGMNISHFSSVPDLGEDPFADPEDRHQEFEALQMPNKDLLNNLPPEAAEAVAKFVAIENESRKSHYIGRGKSLDIPRTKGGYMDISDQDPLPEMPSLKRKTSVPAIAAVPGTVTEKPFQRKTLERSSFSEVSDDASFRRTTTFNFKELQDRKRKVIQSLAPSGKGHRPGSRFMKRVSTWKRDTLMPKALVIKTKGAEI